MANENPKSDENQPAKPQGQTPQGTQGPVQGPTQGGPNPNVTAPVLVIIQEGFSPVKEKKGKD